MFEAVLSLTATNQEFKEIHRYYTSVKENTLKKMQSLMVLSNKLIRVFYTILKSRAAYPMNAGSKQYQGLEELSKVT